MHQNQPILYISLRSPFARRIRLALHRLHVSYEEKTVDVFEENPDLIAANPLGLVPTFKTSNTAVTDSNNILEYLNDCYGGIWPDGLQAKTISRQASIWSAGIMQSTVLFFQEAKLHEIPSPRWLKEHVDSIETTLFHLAKAPEHIWFSQTKDSDGLTQAAWDLCVALEYMDLRIPAINWRSKHSSFSAILEIARKNSYFCETTPPV